MKKNKTTRCALAHYTHVLILMICGLLMERTDCAAQNQPRRDVPGEGHDAEPKTWTRLSPERGIEMLEMIAAQTSANYQKLRTWRGTYTCTSRQYIVKEGVQNQFAKELSPDKMSALWQEGRFTTQFAVDVATESLYNSKKSAKLKFVRPGTTEIVTIPGVSPVDENSAITSEHYLHFDPSAKWPGFMAVMNRAEAKNKRAAFRDAPDDPRARSSVDIVNPTVLFGSSPHQKLGKELSIIIADMKSAPKVSNAVYESDGTQEKWYRLDQTLRGPDSLDLSDVYLTYVFNPLAGFNPRSMTLAKDTARNRMIRRLEWQWESSSGVYIPMNVKDSQYSMDRGVVSFEKELALSESQVNAPVDASQFTYSGLGMKDGDLVMDQINKACYILDKGVLSKLADYDETPSSDAGDAGVRKPLIIWATTAMLGGVFIMVLRRNRLAAKAKGD